MSTCTESEHDPSSPLVSVVIPTYGRDEHLIDAVRSVVNQTYENIELFVVDDGSPTPVAGALANTPFAQFDPGTVIRHNENKGANVARNTGIRAADGKYVAFLDDDDRWDRTKISRQVETFETAGPEVGLVYTGKRTQGPTGTTSTTPTVEGNVIKELLTGQNFGQFSSVMVQSDVIEKAGLPDERFPAWQDREWFFRLAKYCHFKPVPEILTYRRVGLPDSITQKFEQKRDIAYPLFVEKHYSLARSYGLYYARTFLATLRGDIAWSAVRADEYAAARKYFWLAFFANPLYRPVYKHLLASIGGKWTYESAASLRNKLTALLS